MEKIIKIIKKIYQKDLFFYGFLILTNLVISQIPIVLHIFRTPAGSYYPYLDKISFSDWYYLTIIRFGMGPDWFLKIPYVIQDHKASLIQIFFVLLGKVGLITGLGPAEVFAIFRILGGIVFALSVAIFLRKMLARNISRLAFLFFMIAQPFQITGLSDSLSPDVMKWIWHFGEATRRLFINPPHYTFGKGLMILSLYFFVRFSNSSLLRDVFIASIIIFVAGLIYPPPVFILIFSGALSVVCYFVVSFFKKRKNVTQIILKNKRNALGILIYASGALLSLLIIKIELLKGYPWSGWNRVELGWNDPSMHFEKDYLQKLGLLLLFVPFSIKYVWEKRNKYLPYFIFFWFISAFLLFPFANLMKVGKFRLTEGAQIVPLVILAVWGMVVLLDISKKLKFLRNTRRFRKGIIAFFVLVFAFFTFKITNQSIWLLWGLWRNVYVNPKEIKALDYLSYSARKDSIVLADTFTSNFIPAFAQVKTILGFPDIFESYSEFQEEEKRVDNILRNKTLESEARKYFQENQISYVYRDKKTYGEELMYPDLLQKVYENKYIEIYKVRNNYQLF